MKKKIEIDIQTINNELSPLLSSIEGHECEMIISKQTISFESENHMGWLTSKRKKDFEVKLNKENQDKRIKYEVLSIKCSV